MIAANFGIVEIIKLLAERKADLTCRDSCAFTPLLYTAKQNHMPALIYLLHKGSDINVSDSNGCTIAHWAAFKNNVFLLRLLRKLGISMTDLDQKGFTPFQRAFSNDSYDAINYLLEEKELNVLPEKINVEEIKSESIRLMVQAKLDERSGKFDPGRAFWAFWLGHPKRNAFLFYILAVLTGLWGFLNGVFYKDENQFYIMSLLVLVLGFYFLIYAYTFIFKLGFQKSKLPENNEFFEENDNFSRRVKAMKTKDATDMALMDFSKLDLLLSGSLNQASASVSIIYDDHHEMITAAHHNFTFLHYICNLIEKLRFTEALDFDVNRLCPTCLAFKLPKTKHCKHCGVCVPYFNHHSHIFNRCIDYKNHPFYMILLTLQQALLLLYIFLQMVIYWDARTSYTPLAYFETGFLVLKNDGVLVFVVFLVISVMLFYNNLFWWIEIYGILSNQTYNEIFHRTRYPYLYANWNDAKGRTWKVYNNATSHGVSKNVMRYLKRCLS